MMPIFDFRSFVSSPTRLNCWNSHSSHSSGKQQQDDRCSVGVSRRTQTGRTGMETEMLLIVWLRVRPDALTPTPAFCHGTIGPSHSRLRRHLCFSPSLTVKCKFRSTNFPKSGALSRFPYVFWIKKKKKCWWGSVTDKEAAIKWFSSGAKEVKETYV